MSENQPPTRSQRRRAYMRWAKQQQRLRDAQKAAAVRPDPNRLTVISIAAFLKLLPDEAAAAA